MPSNDLFGQRTEIYRGAILDGPYRYALSRILPGPKLRVGLFVGINPSIADHNLDDPTIRKLYGFGKIMGVSHWLVGNKFAYRSTDVKGLAKQPFPIGRQNDEWLDRLARQADVVVVGWGALSKIPENLRTRWRDVAETLREAHDGPLHCWGTCKDGHPAHPLMLGYDTPLVEWRSPTCA